MKGWDVAERMGKGEGRRRLDHCSTLWATQGGQEGTMPSGMTLREYAGLLGLCKQRLSFFLSVARKRRHMGQTQKNKKFEKLKFLDFEEMC